MAIRIGVDLGGTKIEGIALGDDGTVLGQKRLSTPQGDYPAILGTVTALIQELEARHGNGSAVAIGIGTPGSFSMVSGLLRNSNSQCLNGKPLQQDLQDCLQRPIHLANDANCFTLSEARDGAGAGAAVVFGVIIGTGTGGGLVVNGKLLAGRNSIAGEWGHNPLPWPTAQELPGPACYCGKHGCIETFLSGPGFAADHRDSGGAPLDPREIMMAARAGDRICLASFERYAERLAKSLAHVINILDPDVIVLGGGMSNIQELYAAVPRRWGAYVFSDQVTTALRPAVFGDASGVRGAARL